MNAVGRYGDASGDCMQRSFVVASASSRFHSQRSSSVNYNDEIKMNKAIVGELQKKLDHSSYSECCGPLFVPPCMSGGEDVFSKMRKLIEVLGIPAVRLGSGQWGRSLGDRGYDRILTISKVSLENEETFSREDT